MGIKTVGYVEDQPTRWTQDLNILGTTVELPELIAKHHIEHVMICLPLSRYHEALRVFDILSQTLVEECRWWPTSRTWRATSYRGKSRWLASTSACQ